MLNEIEKIIDLHKQGFLTERQAEDQIAAYAQYAFIPYDNAECPVIDVFGLGTHRDPDAYSTDGKPTFAFHHLV